MRTLMMAAHLRSLLVLTLLALAFFFPLLLEPSGVLYSDHSDLLAEHVPARRFLVRSWQENGELPLWCPYLFSGSPFVHDIQVAMFYPPHWALLIVSEEHVGAALSWLVVLHVVLAGWLMYAYAAQRGLCTLPALVAAVGYMFAGRWMMHLLGGGHYILIGLAWLPLVLIGLERAIRGNSLLWGTLAGVAFALLTLGTQPQWTFYAGLFAALWTLGTALELAGRFGGEGPPTRAGTTQALARWLGFGALAVVLAVALAAVQLLPTLEAAKHSSRAAGVGSEDILSGGVRVLLFLVGPALTAEPFNLAWEDRGGLALLWLVAAVLAPVLRGGVVRYQAGVLVFLFLFAMGGAALFQALPGFNLFRQPARMAIIAALPVAYLAGVTTRALVGGELFAEDNLQRCRRWVLRVGIGAGLLCGGFALRQFLQGRAVIPHVYWLILPLTFGGLCWLLWSKRSLSSSRRATVWSVLLLIDLWALTRPLVAVRSEAELYALPDCVQSLAEQRGRVLDRYRTDAAGRPVGTPLGTGAPLALVAEVEAVRGYSPLDTLRYREYLQFIAGEDRPLRALDSDFTYPVMTANFPVVNRNLLDLLGVRHLLQPRGQLPEGADWSEVGRDGDIRVYDFLSGGWQQLGPYTVYRNESALPRAFVVARARPLPDRASVLKALRATDFRETVLLEGAEADDGEANSIRGHQVRIREYRPNRVRLEVDAETGGYLVLADVWYPGWGCTIDGEPTTVYRANYLFRAVKVPAGKHEVVFRFEPASYRVGRAISLSAVVVVILLLSAGAVAARRRAAKPRALSG